MATRKYDNGLTAFALHSGTAAEKKTITALRAETAARPSFARSATSKPVETSPELAARAYLDQALSSKTVRKFSSPSPASQLKLINTEKVPLTGTTIVKFRQRFNDVPVYGSIVSVELDDDNSLVGINSSMGDPDNVSAVAKVSPAQALETVQAQPGVVKASVGKKAPQLQYYFDVRAKKWRLAFIVEQVQVDKRQAVPKRAATRTVSRAVRGDGERLMDFVIDAKTGQLVAKIPRHAHARPARRRKAPPAARKTKTRRPRAASTAPGRDTAIDGKGVERSFGVQDGPPKLLFDPVLNVATFDFGNRDPVRRSGELPGQSIRHPPAWSPAAVSAHANASVVSSFLRDELKRNNIDDRGGRMVSSINCVYARESRAPGEWINAFWDPELRQMVYGQRSDGDGGFVSLAIALDIVAHEMFHGVTDHTARLEYRAQSGAINESLSDIFGLIVANQGRAIEEWSWELGAGLTADGQPFRDLRTPERFDQPAHMRDYQELPDDEANDWGGVHTNSGIHNKVAYNMLTAKKSGQYVLSPSEVAAIFYVAVTQYLSATSGFSDSRRAAMQAAQTLFRNLDTATKNAKLNAVKNAFSSVGIS